MPVTTDDVPGSGRAPGGGGGRRFASWIDALESEAMRVLDGETRAVLMSLEAVQGIVSKARVQERALKRIAVRALKYDGAEDAAHFAQHIKAMAEDGVNGVEPEPPPITWETCRKCWKRFIVGSKCDCKSGGDE